MNLVTLTQFGINGIAVGSIIALAAVGLTLTFGILRLPNFAHGDFLTAGAYFSLWANQAGLPILPAFILGALLTVLGVLICEFLIWKPMRARNVNSTTLMIISIGLALFVRNAILFLGGSAPQNYNLDVPRALAFGPLQIRAYSLWVIGLALLAVLGLHLLLRYTKLGKAMRAVADDIDLARVSGINVQTVVLCTWILAGVLIAISGEMYGLINNLNTNMGWFLVLPMFGAVIVGGIGNPYGAIAGAFIMGLAQEVSVYWLPTNYKMAVALVIMIAVLLFKPQGLFRGTL
jgi:neutral amino acid transport system permease protein